MDYDAVSSVVFGSAFGVTLSYVLFEKIVPLIRVMKNTKIPLHNLNRRRAIKLDSMLFKDTQWLQYPRLLSEFKQELPEDVRRVWMERVSGETTGFVEDLANRFSNSYLFGRNVRSRVKAFYQSSAVREYLTRP